MKSKTLAKRISAVILVSLLTVSVCACSAIKSDNSSTEGSSLSQAEGESSSAEVQFETESSNNDDTIENDYNDASVDGSDENYNADYDEVQTYSDEIPTEWLDNGIFSAYYEDAYALMQTMTIDEKIGQMLFARCPSQNGAEVASTYHLGGYVLFGADFEGKTTEEVKEDIVSYKNAQNIPIAIATDEEGGTVVRVSSNPLLSDEMFLSPRDIYNNGGMDLIETEEAKKATMLSLLYIDTNFAPVCDISTNESDFMYYRSLGQDAQTTANFVSTATEISQSNGVSATLKHFPGYGNNVDTHTGIAIDDRDYETFINNDFIPFEAGINAGAHLVMVSHNIVNCMDSTKPASISADVHNILRNDLGFTGIIITDDLSMDAISEYSGEYPPTVTAVLAGNDMLTITDIDASFNEIKSAVNDGTIDQSLIDHAVMRILAWKYAKGLM